MGAKSEWVRKLLARNDSFASLSTVMQHIVVALLMFVATFQTVPVGAFSQLSEEARTLVRRLLEGDQAVVSPAPQQVSAAAQPEPADGNTAKKNVVAGPDANEKRATQKVRGEVQGEMPKLERSEHKLRLLLEAVHEKCDREKVFDDWMPPTSAEGLGDVFRELVKRHPGTKQQQWIQFYYHDVRDPQTHDSLTTVALLEKRRKLDERNAGLPKKREREAEPLPAVDVGGRGQRAKSTKHLADYVTGADYHRVLADTPEDQAAIATRDRILGPLSSAERHADLSFLAKIDAPLRAGILSALESEQPMQSVRIVEDVASTCFRTNGEVFVRNLVNMSDTSDNKDNHELDVDEKPAVNTVKPDPFKNDFASMELFRSSLLTAFRSVGKVIKQAEAPAPGTSRKKWRADGNSGDLQISRFFECFDVKPAAADSGEVQVSFRKGLSDSVDAWSAARSVCKNKPFVVFANAAKIGGAVALADAVNKHPETTELAWCANSDDEWYSCQDLGSLLFVHSTDSDASLAQLWVAPDTVVFVLPDKPNATFRIRNARVSKAQVISTAFSSVFDVRDIAAKKAELLLAASTRFCYLSKSPLHRFVWCLSVLYCASEGCWDGFGPLLAINSDQKLVGLFNAVVDWIDEDVSANFDARTFTVSSVLERKVAAAVAQKKKGKRAKVGVVTEFLSSYSAQHQVLCRLARMGLQLLADSKQLDGADSFCKFIGIELLESWLVDAQANLPQVQPFEFVRSVSEDLLQQSRSLL